MYAIEAGKMQQAGSNRNVIRPLTIENFLFYFPVAMYTLLLRNIGMMKNENDKLLKQRGMIKCSMTMMKIM